MEKRDQMIYYASTGMLSLFMLFSASMYFFNNEAIQGAFSALGYPTYLIYPLAIAKILGLVAIWTRKSNTLLEWAYAGFFFDFVLAAGAHIAISDGNSGGAFMAIALLLVSYVYQKKVYSS